MFFVDQVMLFLVHLFFPLQVIILLYINQSFFRNQLTYRLLFLILLHINQSFFRNRVTYRLLLLILLHINQSFFRNRVTYRLLFLIVLVKRMFLVCLFQFHLLELILLAVPRIQYRYYLFQ